MVLYKFVFNFNLTLLVTCNAGSTIKCFKHYMFILT